MGDHFSDLLRMGQRLSGLLAQPGDDGDAVEAEDQQRIVRVSNHAGQLNGSLRASLPGAGWATDRGVRRDTIIGVAKYVNASADAAHGSAARH